MGTHGKPIPQLADVVHLPLIMVTFQCWRAADRTMIAAMGRYGSGEEATTVNIGSDILEYDALVLPTLGQTVWCLGDEIRSGWRELSSPKQR